MKVLIGCEESGVVREEFRRRGHDAWSNDFLAARDGSPFHLQMDVFEALHVHCWDMAILHPPCTETCLSGNRFYAATREREARCQFVQALLRETGHIPRVCLEQPMTMLGRYIGPPTQRLNLSMFGEPETKSLWLWLRGLKELEPTKIMTDVKPVVHYESPGIRDGLTRAQRRSTTRLGFAEAMAAQWGTL